MKKLLILITAIVIIVLCIIGGKLFLDKEIVSSDGLTEEQRAVLKMATEAASTDYMNRISDVQDLEKKLVDVIKLRKSLEEKANKTDVMFMVDREIIETKLKYQKKATQEAQQMAEAQLQALEKKKEFLKNKIMTTSDSEVKNELLNVLDKEIDKSEKFKKMAADRVKRREELEKTLLFELEEQTDKMEKVKKKQRTELDDVSLKVTALQKKLDEYKKSIN